MYEPPIPQAMGPRHRTFRHDDRDACGRRRRFVIAAVSLAFALWTTATASANDPRWKRATTGRSGADLRAMAWRRTAIRPIRLGRVDKYRRGNLRSPAPAAPRRSCGAIGCSYSRPSTQAARQTQHSRRPSLSPHSPQAQPTARPLLPIRPKRPAAASGRGRGGGRGGGRPPISTPTPKTLYDFDVLCLDRTSGAVLWQRTAREEVPHEGHHPTHGYASASPVTDGRRLYVSFGSYGIHCYDLDGNKIWERDLGKMQTKRGFGEGASPALHGDTLVVNWDHDGESFVYALDANTGKPRWRVPRDEGTTWTSPLVVEHNGRTQAIVNATGRTRSYDLATGEVIWECGGQVVNPIPTPVAQGGVVYCMTGYNAYAIRAISLDAVGDVTNSDKVVWQYADSAPYVASPLLYDDRLYFPKGEEGILTCLEAATGKPVYAAKRLGEVGSIYSSPTGAGGRVYLPCRNGTTLVLEHGPEFKVLATNKLDDAFSASPVVIGRQLLLRGDKFLYSIVGDE